MRGPVLRALAVALVHVLLVAGVGAKLLWDRAHRPRAWVRTVAYDPDLPIRGRYASLRLAVEVEATLPVTEARQVDLVVVDGRLLASPTDVGDHWIVRAPPGGVWVLRDPVAFFLPEHVPDPTLRSTDEELWAEVTLPHSGPPRPIRLGIREGDGDVVPLALD